MIKATSVTLRMSKELKQALRELALDARRTLSSYIELVLEHHVDQSLARRSGAHSASTYGAQGRRPGKRQKTEPRDPKPKTEADPIDDAIRALRAKT